MDKPINRSKLSLNTGRKTSNLPHQFTRPGSGRTPLLNGHASAKILASSASSNLKPKVVKEPSLNGHISGLTGAKHEVISNGNLAAQTLAEGNTKESTIKNNHKNSNCFSNYHNHKTDYLRCPQTKESDLSAGSNSDSSSFSCWNSWLKSKKLDQTVSFTEKSTVTKKKSISPISQTDSANSDSRGTSIADSICKLPQHEDQIYQYQPLNFYTKEFLLDTGVSELNRSKENTIIL